VAAVGVASAVRTRHPCRSRARLGRRTLGRCRRSRMRHRSYHTCSLHNTLAWRHRIEHSFRRCTCCPLRTPAVRGSTPRQRFRTVANHRAPNSSGAGESVLPSRSPPASALSSATSGLDWTSSSKRDQSWQLAQSAALNASTRQGFGRDRIVQWDACHQRALAPRGAVLTPSISPGRDQPGRVARNARRRAHRSCARCRHVRSALTARQAVRLEPEYRTKCTITAATAMNNRM